MYEKQREQENDHYDTATRKEKFKNRTKKEKTITYRILVEVANSMSSQIGCFGLIDYHIAQYRYLIMIASAIPFIFICLLFQKYFLYGIAPKHCAKQMQVKE